MTDVRKRGGLGGVAKFVWDKQADTLRLPDLAGMTPEQVGFSDSLGVGGVRPDMMRRITGSWGRKDGTQWPGDLVVSGALYGIAGARGHNSGLSATDGGSRIGLDTALATPTGPRNHGPRWISDARVYLGQPAL